jgi:pimeloyl-ACP methyl ester carboxylesterase
MTTPRLVLIPGLGADARVFGPQLKAFPDALTPGWIPPRRRESLASYAERLAATVDSSRPVVLAGLSLGGMLALEMARHLPTQRVVLIASCTHPRAVRRVMRAIEILGRPWPLWSAEWIKSFAPPVMGRGGTVPKDARSVLVDMIRDTPANFIRWGGRAIFAWPGRPDPGVPIAHIHGARDWVIPMKHVRPTRVIPDGSHVLNLSHPEEVIRFLREALDQSRRP